MTNSNPTNNTNLVTNINIDDFRQKILTWYNKHQRELPWRIDYRKNSRSISNPYHTWLSEIMLQQTTVVTVAPYFEKFLKKWPAIHDLAKAMQEDVMHEWAGLGYYARARNLHKCAKVVSEELGGVFPQEQAELEKLPGIGSYTSAAIRAIAFNKPANVVDGNIERIMARIYAVKEPLPDCKAELKRLAGELSDSREDKPGDYAQALMDLGATICTPKSPKCALCPVNNICEAYKIGIAGDLPARKAKKAKPQKHGHVYWITNDKNEVCFERRDEDLMLGGMLGLPTSDWLLTSEKLKKWPKSVSEERFITHSFTHFDLKLHIYSLNYKTGMKLPQNNPIWRSLLNLDELGLPTLFKKVLKGFN